MRATVALSLIALSSCSSSSGPPSPAGGDGGAADAGVDGAFADAGAPDAPACSPTEGGNVQAAWPLPDPTSTGPPRSQSYDTSAAGVVLDNVTQLMWQRQVAPGTYSFADAGAYCACLSLGGHDDWRLPTRIELVTIVDFTKHAPAIDAAAFPDTPGEWFWTSSRLADDPGFAWYVYFESGFTNFIELATRYRVRCVRATSPAAGAQPYVIGGGTVRDTQTRLEWQQAFDPGMRAWADAQTYCAGLSLAGGGWRLPSMKELQSLVDDTRASPAIDPDAFPGTPSDPFWTATPVEGTPGSAWRVSFEHGYTYDSVATYEYHARCVRDF